MGFCLVEIFSRVLQRCQCDIDPIALKSYLMPFPRQNEIKEQTVAQKEQFILINSSNMSVLTCFFVSDFLKHIHAVFCGLTLMVILTDTSPYIYYSN